MSLRRIAPALLGPLALACAGAPLPPPGRVHAEVGPSSPVVPVPLPARWIQSGGATSVGPAVPGGTLVLLGGRRAVVHPDGTLEGERAPAPEPLAEIAEVPGKEVGPRLVGRGEHGVYRFDDPLGAPVALALSQQRIARIGAGPGVVAVWTSGSDLPRFVDVESGREQAVPGLPAPPLVALAFADRQRGAGVFEAVGLAITGDGGATWRPAGETSPGEALRVSGLRRRGGGLYAYAFADGPEGAIDLASARLGPLSPQRPQPDESRLLRWIRVTGRDPLEAVASGGLDLPGGAYALVASHGLLARVDPRSGAVDEIVDLARTKWVSPCGAGRAGQTAFVACALSDDVSRDLFDPFGVVEVPLADKALPAGRPDLVRNGEAELRVSPSGGAMLLAPCATGDLGSGCVRQPDGRWKTISIAGELAERGVGPLADGRLAFLRGLSDSDEAPPAEAASPPAPEGPEARTRSLHVAVVGADGKEHALGPIGFSPSRGYVRVQSPIEEDLDHTLRFVVEDGDGPFAVAASLGKEGAQVHRIPDATAARLRAGRGIAVGEGRVLASLDGGASWSPIPAPPAVLEAATMAATSYDEPGQLEVSELGAKVGSVLRLGWSPPDAAADGAGPVEAPRSPSAATLLGPREPTSGRPEPWLTCTAQGPVPGVAPLAEGKDARALLAAKPTRSPAVRHELAVWSSSRAGMLDAVALLDEEGPSSPGGGPSSWTFRWHDPQEIGGKVRSASIPAPQGATWGPSLRFAAASGPRAMFVVRSGGKLRFVRVESTGKADMVEGPSDLLPTEVSFGEGRSEVIAWARETSIVAWIPGERPRTVARLGTHAVRSVGAPTAAGVPLLLGASDWALLRTLPILPESAPAAAPSLDGWTRIPPLPRHPEALPICAGKAAGARFTRASLSLHAEIDGVPESAGQAVYDVRVDGTTACVAGVTAALSLDTRAAKTAPSAAKPPKPPGDPAAFVRVDLVGKRAEGGERGLPPAAIERMRCRLGEKP
jgi:hypothetical protein